MIQLIEITDSHRAAIVSGAEALTELSGLEVPGGWPIHPEIFERACNPAWPLFLFVDPELSSIVGSGGFLSSPDDNGLVQIGYEVAPQFRGKGIATEAMQAILSRKPETPLVAAVAPANPSSIAVLRKLGFRETGQTVVHGEATVSLWINLREQQP